MDWVRMMTSPHLILGDSGCLSVIVYLAFPPPPTISQNTEKTDDEQKKGTGLWNRVGLPIGDCTCKHQGIHSSEVDGYGL